MTIAATGGVETTIIVNETTYRIHTFTSSGTFSVFTGGDIEYLVVAGGGSGGGSQSVSIASGGGGAGGVLTDSYTISTGNHTITIGAGGSNTAGFVVGGSGNNSSIAFSSGPTITATGGGGGGTWTVQATNGGSGGGAGENGQSLGPGSGTSGQGFNGGDDLGYDNGAASAAGGGGGAGGLGGTVPDSATGGAGGIGRLLSITGVGVYYAGGGGGAGSSGGGLGGQGGGGSGRTVTSGQGSAGNANTGSGGGGSLSNGNDPAYAGGSGGSGVVIIRYSVPPPIFEPESIEFNAGSLGGDGGPYAGGGGGAGGYLLSNADVPVDVLQNRDVLAITANGINTGQNNTFIDSSTNNLTITRNGNTAQGSFSPYSPAGWSGYFDGTGDYLSIPYSTSAFDWWTSDYTVEAWVYPTSFTGWSYTEGAAIQPTLIGNKQHNTGTHYWGFGLNSTGNVLFSYFNGVHNRGISLGSATLNAWSHIAMVKSGTEVILYLNGVGTSIGNVSGTPQSDVNIPLTIGVANNNFINGYVNGIRITKGTAVYTSTFVPPTTALTAIPNTSLLTLQDNRFVDRSTNNSTITRNGDTRILSFSPLLSTVSYNPTIHGGSAFFDGTGDGLVTATNPVLALDTGDFTYEAWIYPTSNPNWGQIVGPAYSATGIVLFNQAGSLVAYGSTSLLTWSGILQLNIWQHVVLTRQAGTLYLYHNGIRHATSAANSSTLSNSIFYIGQNSSGTENFFGYISNVRVVKGTAVYTANFTIPASPVTTITNTSLLLNFTNANIVDASGKHNIETLNGAQVSTSVTKYGSGSMFFDGVDDYLVIPNNLNLVLAGGPWTAECWVNPSGNYSTWRAIFSKRSSGTSTTSYQGYLRISTGVVGFFNGTTYDSATVLAANQWSHCAWVYTGTAIQIYVNGVQVLNTAVTITDINEPLTIGGLRGLTEFFAGYIDDFRITKGAARYTATFTPPDEIYQVLEDQSRGYGADGSVLQAGEDNSLGGGAGGGSSETVGGGGGGVEVNGLVLSVAYTASGGTITTYTDTNSVSYTQHIFTSSGVFETAAELNAEILVVAGGGGGGYNAGAGGGAGGMIVASQTVVAGTYTIIVGAGGAGRTTDVGTGDQGSNSTWFNLNAIGGGGGKSSAGSGANGGSGGGGAAVGTGGSGIAGQGFAGGNGTGADGASRAGGGGGGAGAVGSNQGTNNGAGGIGRIWPTGGATYYAGGGGGGQHSGTGGAGGLGGGGAGGNGGGGGPGSTNGTPGTANTGGGGGGGGGYGLSGATGGSGIVIVRYTEALFSLAQGGAVNEGGEGSGGGLDGVNGNGGLYGGGGAGTTNSTVDPLVGNGASGALRIVWPSTRQFPYPNDFPETVTNLTNSTLQNNILAIDTPEQSIPMITAAVSIKESTNWTNNLSNVYQIGTTVTYDTKFPVSSPRPVPESPFVAVKELQVVVTEIDHELMLINNDIDNLATWNEPTKYQRIDRVTSENDPRRITVRLLNYVVGVTGEGALVPTQIQTWF